MPNTGEFIAVWVPSLLASPCHKAAGRLSAGLCAGFPPQHPPVAAELHPDTPVCTYCPGCTPEEILEKISNHHYWDPLGEDCPEGLRKVIEQCRAFDPSQRPSAEGKCLSWTFAPQALCILQSVTSAGSFVPYFPYEFAWLCVLGSCLDLPFYANKSPSSRPHTLTFISPCHDNNHQALCSFGMA